MIRSVVIKLWTVSCWLIFHHTDWSTFTSYRVRFVYNWARKVSAFIRKTQRGLKMQIFLQRSFSFTQRKKPHKAQEQKVWAWVKKSFSPRCWAAARSISSNNRSNFITATSRSNYTETGTNYTQTGTNWTNAWTNWTQTGSPGRVNWCRGMWMPQWFFLIHSTQ